MGENLPWSCLCKLKMKESFDLQLFYFGNKWEFQLGETRLQKARLGLSLSCYIIKSKEACRNWQN
jgi:hypothetical protein